MQTKEYENLRCFYISSMLVLISDSTTSSYEPAHHFLVSTDDSAARVEYQGNLL